MLLILTSRGAEYCGRVDQHDYQLYLAINDIDHTKTKAMSPQTKGICERLLQTILSKLYQITFRKKLYVSMEELQKDLENTITMNEFIKARCAAAERQWKLCLMVNRFGLRKIELKSNLTGTFKNRVTVRSSLSHYNLMHCFFWCNTLF